MPFRFRSNDLRVEPGQAGNLTYYLVHDPKTKVQHRLYAAEFEVAQLLDGKRAEQKVAKMVSKKLGLTIEAVDVRAFAQQLLALGFVEEQSG